MVLPIASNNAVFPPGNPVHFLHLGLHSLQEFPELGGRGVTPVHQEIGVLQAHLGIPHPEALQARGIDQAPRLLPRGVLEDASRTARALGLAGYPFQSALGQAGADLHRIALHQAGGGGQDHIASREPAPTVPELSWFRRLLRQFPGWSEEAVAGQDMHPLATMGSRIHMDGPPQAAGNPPGPFQT